MSGFHITVQQFTCIQDFKTGLVFFGPLLPEFGVHLINIVCEVVGVPNWNACGRVVRAPDLKSGGPRFESCSDH